ncbi:hypothetical protein [Nocardia grenadensis]|uniref:hypothetical protein n=1 Tax=Nocardia grenadensis TaxID=931537 RepID=UPI000AB4CA25|nr:hypothetical protein [Nocardia grenadensis]
MSRRSAAPKWRYPNPHPRTRTGRCHLCRREILTALYDARPHHFDPQHLSLTGEILALAQGYRTWFIADGNLSRRTTWAINTSPHGLGGKIVRDHRCESQPTPAEMKFEEIPDADNPGF